MVLSRKEKNALDAIVTELEASAATAPEHSATRSALYRQAATLRTVIAPAVVSRDGRADGHRC